MKTPIKIYWICAMLVLAAFVSHADNPCITTPTTNFLECFDGTLSPGYVFSPTNITVLVGQEIPQPIVSGLSINNGIYWYYYSNVCYPTMDGWVTNSIDYSLGNPSFDPSFPQVLWLPGVYNYTGAVVATESPCDGPVTFPFGVVTVNVVSNNPTYPLIDVDFGQGTVSPKSGFAAVGDSSSDYWNEYGQINTNYGSLVNLLSVGRQATSVGMTVYDLPTYGANGSPDPMYNDFLSNSGGGYITITNLPDGKYNIYLYSDDGHFSLTVGDRYDDLIEYLGTKTCHDLPLSSPLVWQPGVQYVVFSNVVAGVDSIVTIGVGPGQSGTASICGMQIALTNNIQPSIPEIFSFNPASGYPGTNVTIVGTNFSPVASEDVVYFGAVQATVISASPTNLVVIEPLGATFAPISVTVNGLTAYADKPFLPTFPGNGSSISSSDFSRLDLTVGSGASRVVIADLDGDGKPDLIVADSYGGDISIYQNLSTNGLLTANSFGPRIVLPMIQGQYGNPVTVAVADLDGDGKPDIIAINSDSDLVSIYRNISSPGTITASSFAPRIDLRAPGGMNEVAIADLNGDDKPDLVTVENQTPGSVAIFQNVSTPGNIAFDSYIQLPGDSGLRSIAVGDLDGDGHPDLVTGSYGGTVAVYRNLGVSGNITTSSFASRVDLTSLPQVNNIALGDMDGDGKLDIVVGEGNTANAVSVFRNTSSLGTITTSSFAAPVNFSLGGWGDGVALGDLNGDGKPDVAADTQLANWLSLFQNNSSPGGFTSSSLGSRVDLSSGSNPNGVSIGDLNGDGRPEVVLANSYSGTISIYQNLTPLTPSVIQLNPTNQTVTAGSTATVTATINTSSLCDDQVTYQWQHDETNIADILVNTVAGDGSEGAEYGDGGPAIDAALSFPYDVALDREGNFYIADTSNNAIRKVGADGIINTVAGEGPSAGYSGDGGPATAALLNTPMGVAVDAIGDIYIADTGNNRVRMVNPEGIITTIAGNGTGGFSGDGGPATAAELNGPVGVAVDASGNLYIADAGNNRIRIVNSAGTISTFAGNGTGGYSGDGGPAASAELNNPQHITLDSSGDLYIADANNNVIREVGVSGTITTVAGNGITGYSGDGGPSTSAELDGPSGVAIDASGNLFISDSWNNAIRQVTPGGIINTIVGVDSIRFPLGLASDNEGNLYLADPDESVIHQIWYRQTTLSLPDISWTDAGAYRLIISSPCGSVTSSVANVMVDFPPIVTNQPASLAVLQGCTATLTVGAIGTAPLSYQWECNGIIVPGATNATLSFSPAQLLQSGLYSVVVSNPYGSVNSYLAALRVRVPGVVMLDAPLAYAPYQISLTNLTNVVAIASSGYYGETNLALKADGTVVYWTCDPTNFEYEWNTETPGLYIYTNGHFGIYNVQVTNLTAVVVPVQGLSNVVDIAEGYDYATGETPPSYYALLTNGNVIGWGNSENSTFFTPPYFYPYGQSNIVEISANGEGWVVLFNNGTDDQQDGFTNITSVASTGSFQYSIISGGKLFSDMGSGVFWQEDYSWPLDQISNVTNPIEIFGGPDFTLTLQSNLTVTAFGDNSSGQLDIPADLTNVFTLSSANGGIAGAGGGPNSFTHCVALKRDGTLEEWGSEYGSQAAGSNWVGVAAGALTDFELEDWAIYGSPQITLQPQSQTVCSGVTVTFSAAATGGTITYQWQKNGVNLSDGGNISGSATATLTITGVSSSDQGTYQLILSNAGGSVSSAAATLTVAATCTEPTINQQPQNQFGCPGSATAFSVAVTGDGPISYQWQKNGVNLSDGGNISGSATATLIVSSVSGSDVASYDVLISNPAGGEYSSSATLSLIAPPVITTQPLSQTVNAGGNVQFTVAATSEGAISYQWLLNGQPLNGQTAPTLTLSNVQPYQFGSYSCIVSDCAGSVYSSPAFLNAGLSIYITEPKNDADIP